MSTHKNNNQFTEPAVLAGMWDLLYGEHPNLLTGGALFAAPKTYSTPQDLTAFTKLNAPVVPTKHGHNVISDGGIASFLNIEIKIPLSPLFVKDLAGRMIYVGFGPEQKTDSEWKHHRLATFPRHCRHVGPHILGFESLENVFFTLFRTLDVMDMGSPDASDDGAGLSAAYPENETLPEAYTGLNLFPYKLRLDTFYTDGWRLPQTEMLFTKRLRVLRPQAEAAGNGFMQRWTNRPANQSYLEFYDQNGGEAWFNDLFEAGCTVIPTFEACNGYNKVGTDFALEDYWSGRAVEGLHEVVSSVPDAAPAGTILEVLEPGYALRHFIHPAKVVVSDGSGYASPHAHAQAPLLPDLRLPHQRCVSTWGATWLPTHPAHFEAPALWGWDVVTGRFMQLSGPLWDPLHYYYDSVDRVIAAVEALPEGETLAPVPADMKARFYPVSAMKGFDTLHVEERGKRADRSSPIRSAAVRVKTENFSSTVGYHPLPLHFEPEFDTWFFPELHPRNRDILPLPPQLAERVCPVIRASVSPTEYRQSVTHADDKYWTSMRGVLLPFTGIPTQDYPFLRRYLESETPVEDILKLTPVFLEMPPVSLLNMTSQQLAASHEHLLASDTALSSEQEDEGPGETPSGLADAVFDLKERALKLLQSRYKLYRDEPAVYAYAQWNGVPPQAVDDLVMLIRAEREALEAENRTKPMRPEDAGVFVAALAGPATR